MISWFLNQEPGHTACCSCSILHSDCSEIWISKNEISTERIKMSVTCQQKSWPCNPDIHISYTELNSYNSYPDNRTQNRKVLLSKFYNLNSLCKYCFSPRPLQKVYEPIPVYSPDFNERYPGHKHRGLITVSKLLLFRIFLRKLSCDFSALPFTPLFIN